MRPPLSRRERVFIGVSLAIVVALAWHAFSVVAGTLHEYPWDGKVDWFAARGWWSHVDPYSKEQLKVIKLDGIGHPPTTPFWFLPLASLELKQLGFALGLFVVTLLIAHWTLLAYALDWPSNRWARLCAIAAGVVVTLSTPWMPYHLNLAQLSEIIAFFVVAGWFFVRRGDDVLGGVALGLACTLKFYPGLMVLALLLSRRWRVVIAASLTWLAVNAVMLSRYGLAAWPEFFRGNRILTEYWIGNLRNGSIFGIVLRAFVPGCKGASRSIPAATELAIAIAVVSLAFLWWLTRKRWQSRRTMDLPYALFSVAGYFFNPWIWEHYNVLLIFPLYLAADILWRGRVTPADPPLHRVTRALGGVVLVGVVGILLFLPLGYCAALYPPGRNVIRHIGMHAAEVTNWISPVAIMILFVAMLWPIRRGLANERAA